MSKIAIATIHTNKLGDGSPDTAIINGYDIQIDLPALTGSERQVAWATSIRNAAIRDYLDTYLIRSLKKMAQGGWNTEAHQAALAGATAGLAKMADDLGAVTDARAWIEAADGSKSLLTVKALMRKAA